MKEVQLHGILTFRIPQNWVEETEPNGFGVYYLAAPDSGTLRVNILSFRKPGCVNQKSYALALGKALTPGNVEVLANGHLLRIDSLPAEEEGTALLTRCWQLARVYPPDEVRLATFTHTLLTKSINTRGAQDELGSIDQEVRRASFIDLSPHEVRERMD